MIDILWNSQVLGAMQAHACLTEEEKNVMKDWADGKSVASTSMNRNISDSTQTLYTISTQEDSHQAAIHAEVVKIIEAYRKEHGEPPAAMMAVYEYLHKRHIDNLAESRRYQDIFKGR